LLIATFACVVATTTVVNLNNWSVFELGI